MKRMRAVLFGLGFATLPAGSMLIASCSGDDGNTDGGASNLTVGCSNDLSDRTAVGTYVSGGRSWVLGDDCHACLGSNASQGDTWSSSFTPARDAIRIDVRHADGTQGQTFYVRNGGQSLDVAQNSVASRDAVQVRACGAAQGSYAATVGGLEWSRAIPARRVTWAQAQSYCASLSTGGGGWRLPTRDEWLQIATRFTSQRAFGEDGWFWTSTSGETADTAWAVTTAGAINANQTSTSAFVRCVR